ncbi:MAG: putative dimethyl sulfoxide reductase chain YnfF [Paraeggerthella hongkongensis]|uniref:molybdopterin-containing oxidoreductase family protein n=1 Tax=Paraeggerthella hominis TaxID=2897351 RepID=UPI0030DECACD
MKHAEGTALSAAIGRRSFLKGSAAAAVAAGLGSSLYGSEFALASEKEASTSEEVVNPGTCRGGCGAGCQMNVHVRDGKIVKTSRRKQSDPDVTRVCNKGLTHALRVYAEDRLKYPMKRVGERGEGKWEQISWDEAIATISDKWKEVNEKYGPRANAFLCGSGNITPDSQHGKRLCSAMGATLLDAAQDRVFYASFPPIVGGFKGAGGGGRNDLKNAKHIFIWGFNPSEGDSQTFHYFLRAKVEHGAKMIVIDPTFTIAASKADLFVPIHPGTDGALALAMANVLVNEGLAKEDFLRSDTVAPCLVKETDGTYLRLSDIGKATAGTPEDKCVVRAADGTLGALGEIPDPVIRGTFTIEGVKVTAAYDLLLERVAEWTPEKASQICDVPVETIRELAHMVQDGHNSVNIGLGLDHVTNGMATFSSILSMCMIAGQYGHPGNTAKGMFRGEISIGWMPYGLANPKGAPGSQVFYSPALLNCMESKKYGDKDINIKTLYIWDHNLFGTQVGGVRWRKFLEDVELLVVADVVSTSTTNYADIVLPACHYFETETASGDDTRYVFHNAKSAEPLYESKSDFDIFKMLFEKMNLQEYDFKDIDELMNAVFDNPTAKKINLTWDRVKKEGSVLTFEPDDRVMGQEGTYGTPTGRLQFYQESIPLDTDYGQKIDFMKERLPYWEPPMEAWRENPLAEKYPLVFTSERSKYKVHTQYTRVPWLLEFEDEPYVAVNPVDCEARGISDGDYIRMFNDRGTCTLRVRFNNGIRPGMVVIDHGWDLDQFVDGFYCDLLGYNVTPVVANSYYFDTLIEIEKATI